MSYILGLCSWITAAFVFLTVYPFENEIANAVCFPCLSLMSLVLISVASCMEDKLERRIKALEDKLECKKEGDGNG